MIVSNLFTQLFFAPEPSQEIEAFISLDFLTPFKIIRGLQLCSALCVDYCLFHIFPVSIFDDKNTNKITANYDNAIYQEYSTHKPMNTQHTETYINDIIVHYNM